MRARSLGTVGTVCQKQRLAALARGMFWVPVLLALLFALRDATATSLSHDRPAKGAKDAASAAGFAIEPTPKWVAEVALEPAPGASRAGLHLALVDRQTRIGREATVRYVHKIRVIDEAAGLTSGSQIQIDFDPLYQKLVLHGIVIWRDGRRIDKLDRKLVNLLHRETRLEAQMYDGRITASRVLDDVRIGDRIEWSYSLRGENPVFGGKFVDVDWSSTSAGPTELYQYRLLAPPDRTIRYQTMGSSYEVSSTVRAGVRETMIRRRKVPQLEGDPNTPLSEFLPEQVFWSEFSDWAQVARWARELFAKALGNSADLAVQTQAIRAQGAAPEEQARRALDFVQTQIRYFGTEMGEYSHQPARPEKVLEQRFGDCKDKVTLLVALLGELGVSAEPVLVSTSYREAVDSMLPSPLAFNHVIVRVQLGGSALWLDGTRAFQTGALDGRGSVGLGKGLIARDDADAGLVDLPGTDQEVRVAAEEVLRVARFSEDPVLAVRLRYYGEFAELLRASLANRPVAELEKELVGEFARAYPRLRKVADLAIEEDPVRNALAVRLSLALPDYWSYPEQQRLSGKFSLVILMSSLRLPSQAPRTRALQIPSPGIYRETLAYDFPEEVYTKPAANHFDEQNKYFTYHVRQDSASSANKIEGELQLLRDRVEASEWNDYLAAIVKVWPRLGGTLNVPAVRVAQLDKLRSDGQALSEDLRKGKIKVATATQAKARMTILVLQAQLDSGRLNPKLRAQALVRLGEQFDSLGRLAEAAENFQSALQLDASNAEAHAGAAVNAMLSRRDDQVDAEVEKALALTPSDLAPRYTRVFSNYNRGRYRQTQEETLELLKNTNEVERSYAAVWLYLAARRLGADGAKAIESHLPSGSDPAWPFPVLQLFANKIDFDQAVKAANEDDRPSPERLCELYYYAGEQELLNGNARRAKQYLRRSIDTGVTEFNEYAFARRELDLLEAQ